MKAIPEAVKKYMIEIDHRGIGRAYSDKNTEYYVLQKPLGRVPSGSIFYYDPEDNIRGSIGAGCLKLAWTENGGCYGALAGDSVVFHETFRHDETMFQKSEFTLEQERKSKNKERNNTIDKIISLLTDLKNNL